MVNQNFNQTENKKSGLLCRDCGRPIHLEINEAFRRNRREIDNCILCTRCYEETRNMSKEELNLMKQKKQAEIDKKTKNFKNPDFIKQICQIDDYLVENIAYFDPEDLETKVRDWKGDFVMKDWSKGHIMLFDKRFAENSFGSSFENWNVRVDLPNNFLAILINEKEAETAASLVNKDEVWTKINRYIIYACLSK